MLKHFKATNGHATRNIVKRCKSLIDGAPISRPSTPSYSSHEPISHASKPSGSLNSSPFAILLDFNLFGIEKYFECREKLMTKLEML